MRNLHLDISFLITLYINEANSVLIISSQEDPSASPEASLLQCLAHLAIDSVPLPENSMQLPVCAFLTPVILSTLPWDKPQPWGQYFRFMCTTYQLQELSPAGLRTSYCIDGLIASTEASWDKCIHPTLLLLTVHHVPCMVHSLTQDSLLPLGALEQW